MEHRPPSKAVDALDHLLKIGSHELPEHGERDKWPALRAQVADDQVKVDPSVSDVRRARIVLQVEISEGAAKEVNPLWPLGHVHEHLLPAAHQRGPLPDVRKSAKQRVPLVTAALLLELRSIQAVRRRPVEDLQLGEALRAGQRALAVLPQRAPWSRLVNEPLAPEVLEDAATDRAFGGRRGIEVPHIDAERVEQFVLIAMPNMGEQS